MYEIEEEIKRRPPPAIDLSLRIKPYVSNAHQNQPVKSIEDTLTPNNLNIKKSNEKNINMDKRNNFIMNVTQNGKELNRRRKADKVSFF